MSGQSGAQSSSTLPQSSGAQTGMQTDTAQMQTQIQDAFNSDNTLATSNINVNVTDSSIELSGTVPTGKEKQTAKRIAQSYAGNRKVVDHLTVTGRGRNRGSNVDKQPLPEQPTPNTPHR